MTCKALTLAALAAATTLAGAGAASAQEFRGGFGSGGDWAFRPPPPAVQVDYRHGGGLGFGGLELRGREDRLQGRLDQEARDGGISRWRAFHAYGELNAVRRDQHDLWARQGGLYPQQVSWLNGRLDRVGAELASGGFGYGYPQPPRW